MRRLVSDAIVLRTVACGEADRMVTLFSSDLGRVNAFAAHARKSRRRFAGALDPFTAVRATLVERRGDTWRLDGADVIDSFPELRRDLTLIARAGYAVELVRELCRDHEPHGDLYSSLARFLAHLARSPSAPEDLLRFELEALSAVGLTPQLSSCAACGAPSAAGDGFDAARGGVICRRCADKPLRPFGAGGRLLARLQRGEPVPPLPGESGDRAVRGEAARSRSEARALLDEFLRYHLGVRLRSAQFMNEVGVE